MQDLIVENEILKEEIRVSRESAEITASLVVKQFEETERILQRFQMANAQRKTVLDSASHMAIIATDKRGGIIVFNKCAERMLGYRAGEVIGRLTPLVFHDPKELQEKAAIAGMDVKHPVEGIDLFFHYAMQTTQEQQEWIYLHRDGTAFPVTLSINPLRDPDGMVNGFLCIATDITEKKRSEIALRESERNYRLLINNIPNVVFKGYPDGTIDFFDDKIESITGYPKEMFLSKALKWTDLIVEEDKPRAKKIFLDALKSNRQYIREYRIRKKKGEVVWLQASSQIVCDENGRVDFVSGAFLDITERKMAEAALHDSEEKYRSLFDSGPNPIFVLDPADLRILDVSPAALDAYGYTKDELLGRCFGELGEFEIHEATLYTDSATGGADGCFINQKARHLKKDGTPFYIRVKACPIKYQDREALILAATDITEAIEKDAQLFQSSKMTTLGEMSAGIAHELTQPLNAIKIGNDYLKLKIEKGNPVSSEELNRMATAVTDQVQRASEIINRLREFGRKPDFKKEPVNFNTIITDVLKIIGRQLSLNNIHVVYDLAENLPTILANPNRLEQVLFNLVTNARDAIGQQPDDTGGINKRNIIIETYVGNDDVVCAVADTGSGIPDENRDKIFEPFFTTKEVGKGMGLGLAITYGIVRDYGGNITVRSKVGKGTRFEMRFKRA
ncbi:MAG: PAS domain S-box protein [Desulfosarcina sp.]|nr:PAS domain S-box protein [Desulfosarcina sp.]MBC2744261.1 PAS domain S-box protein [Desulfosarcina sp.]MBC2767170.1 PAS domain S-box protein [Desulfosarcina sp.]